VPKLQVVLESAVCENSAVVCVISEIAICNGLSRNVMHCVGKIQSVKTVARHGVCEHFPLKE
jgi:hypothetical protein